MLLKLNLGTNTFLNFMMEREIAFLRNACGYRYISYTDMIPPDHGYYLFLRNEICVEI